MNNIVTRICVLTAAFVLAGCAGFPPLQQPVAVHQATIIDAKPTVRANFTPSTGGAVAGAALGGLAGNQIGKGNGKKLATVLGAVAGAATGATVAGTTTNVPATQVAMRDDQTGEVITATFDGQWTLGTKVRYSKDGNKIVLH